MVVSTYDSIIFVYCFRSVLINKGGFMKLFFLFLVSISFAFGCASIDNEKEIPHCSKVIKNFYEKIEKEKFIIGYPFTSTSVVAFIGINPQNTSQIKALCLISMDIQRNTASCVKSGDIIGECFIGGDFGNAWYGEGEKTILKNQPTY